MVHVPAKFWQKQQCIFELQCKNEMWRMDRQMERRMGGGAFRYLPNWTFVAAGDKNCDKTIKDFRPMFPNYKLLLSKSFQNIFYLDIATPEPNPL